MAIDPFRMGFFGLIIVELSRGTAIKIAVLNKVSGNDQKGIPTKTRD
jgi:hypothetical protein